MSAIKCIGCAAGLASFVLTWTTVALCLALAIAGAYVVRAIWRAGIE